MFSEVLYRLSKRKSRQHLYDWIEEATRLHSLMTGKRILNIGAGGEITSRLVAMGIEFQSLDIDLARQPDILANIESMNSLPDNSIDAIFCFEVLEHVAHPERAASEISRILRPGGLLIGSTPFLLGIHDAPADFYRFTRHGLRLIFSGFDELALRERNGYFAAVATLIYRRFAHPPPLPLRLQIAAPALVILGVLVESLDKLLPSPMATTGYFFIYRKHTAPTALSSDDRHG